MLQFLADFPRPPHGVALVSLWLLFPAAALLGALGRRMQGGVLSQWLGVDIGDFPPRLLFAVILGAAGFGAGLVWWEALALVAAAFAGTTVAVGGMSAVTWRDAGLLLVHGLGVAAPIVALAWLGGFAWWWPLAACLARPALYFAARALPLNAPWLGCKTVDFCPTAELTSGAALGVAVVAAVI